MEDGGEIGGGEEEAAWLAAEIGREMGEVGGGEEILAVVFGGMQGFGVGAEIALLGGLLLFLVPVVDGVVEAAISGVEIVRGIELTIDERLEEELDGAVDARGLIVEEDGPEGSGVGEEIGGGGAAGVADGGAGDGEHGEGDGGEVEFEGIGDGGGVGGHGRWEDVDGEGFDVEEVGGGREFGDFYAGLHIGVLW